MHGLTRLVLFICAAQRHYGHCNEMSTCTHGFGFIPPKNKCLLKMYLKMACKREREHIAWRRSYLPYLRWYWAGGAQPGRLIVAITSTFKKPQKFWYTTGLLDKALRPAPKLFPAWATITHVFMRVSLHQEADGCPYSVMCTKMSSKHTVATQFSGHCQGR